jgi:hypothetical protein
MRHAGESRHPDKPEPVWQLLDTGFRRYDG